jgi:choline dehydrogenase-like flavoprotein
VVASRLSDASPSLSILVIEAGPDSAHDPAVRVPVLSFGNTLPTSKNTLFYEGVPEPTIGDRRIVVPAGGTLGGGSAINLSTYSRAQRTDLDAWKTPGWGANDLLPLMKRVETYHGPGSAETHGDSGPVQVSASTFRVSETEEGFIAAAASRGWPEAVDMQDLDTANVVQRNLRYITTYGDRSDAADAYLRPRLKDGKHPGLQVLVEHQVGRVLFDGTKATGVEVRPNPKFQPAVASRTIKARRLVVLSCGALGTPLVLERSGVGSPEVLAKAGVKVLADLPGVGHQYLDHHLHGKSKLTMCSKINADPSQSTPTYRASPPSRPSTQSSQVVATSATS